MDNKAPSFNKRANAVLTAFLGLTAWSATWTFAAPKAKISRGPACPADMVAVGSWCVDKYEASVWSGAACTGTQYGDRTDDYTTRAGCGDNGSGCLNKMYACSLGPDTTRPSVEITWFQAAMACASAGKELLPNAVWQTAALGTPEPGSDNKVCNVSHYGTPANTGALPACVSDFGAFDMAGNAWEWVADWGTAGGGASDPTVTPATITGVEWDGDKTGYGNDVTWSVGGQAFSKYNSMGWTKGLAPAVRRGGYWGDGPRAGVYAFSAYSGPTDWDINTGFRCGRPRRQ